ncbi:hypothetical protein [Clostridium intestinale]|uniref:Uncharacterized protein n=1 Tax=Clostridium intestinale TaxID=36845 RepID=A0A7D6VS81_9CLOT|nr:hypothetical protein [Clostridium intestinale]QLY77812.1 hypothetical protein HZF06_11880 [Clostridium intestinale]
MIKPLENPCMECCIACKKYKSVKEMQQKCETRKERKRATDRQIYKARKQRKGREATQNNGGGIMVIQESEIKKAGAWEYQELKIDLEKLIHEKDKNQQCLKEISK